MHSTAPPAAHESGPEPLLGGTLALMSFYARTGHAGAARKIARNLALLGHHPQLSAPLRAICRRLFGDWVRTAEGVDRAPRLAGLPEEPSPLLHRAGR